MNEIERAERIQAWKAFLIPSLLFVACLLNAAGIYIMYAGNSVGIVFLGLGLTVIVGGMIAFVTFQNTKRAKGQWKRISPDIVEPTDDGVTSEELGPTEQGSVERPKAGVL
jgi:hypothetical protein